MSNTNQFHNKTHFCFCHCTCAYGCIFQRHDIHLIKRLKPAVFPPTPVTERYKGVLHTWEHRLEGYYDWEFIKTTITQGIRLGIDESHSNIDKLLAKNSFYIDMTPKQTKAITEWIIKGVDRGYIAGPYPLDFKFPFQLHTVPLFVVPKPKQDEWRTIAHASYRGLGGTQWSVNDLIKNTRKQVLYVTHKETVQMMQAAGRNAWYWVVDAEDAYYRLPIHPSQYKYLGLKWLNLLWFFMSEAMGVGSAPRDYTRFADAIEYAVVKACEIVAFLNGIQLIRHYVDDFYGANSKKKDALKIFNCTRQTFVDFNIPTRDSKCKWPAQSRKIVGRLYDSRKMSMMPSRIWRHKALSFLYYTVKYRLLNLKAAQILEGTLVSGADLVYPGKTFVRRLVALIYDPRAQKNGWIYINDFLLEDLRWWINVLEKENHVTVTYDFYLRRPDQGDHSIWTDASGGIGVGGFLDKEAYQVNWADTSYSQLLKERPYIDIQVLELLGTLVALEIWWPKLVGRSVTLYNDNASAAAAIASKAPKLWRNDMHYLIRRIAFLAVEKRFYFWGIHIKGSLNDIADALSRFKMGPKWDWKALGYKMIDATKLVEKHIQALRSFYPNRDKTYWQWSENQRQVLSRQIAKAKQERERYGNQKIPKMKRNYDLTYNILTRDRYDGYCCLE